MQGSNACWAIIGEGNSQPGFNGIRLPKVRQLQERSGNAPVFSPRKAPEMWLSPEPAFWRMEMKKPPGRHEAAWRLHWVIFEKPHLLILNSRRQEVGLGGFGERRMGYVMNGSRTADSVKLILSLIFEAFGGPLFSLSRPHDLRLAGFVRFTRRYSGVPEAGGQRTGREAGSFGARGRPGP